MSESWINLGLAALGQDDYGRAKSSFEEALVLSRTLGKKPTTMNALEGMATLAGARGEDERAARLQGAAEAAREATGIALSPTERALHESRLGAVQSRLGARWEEMISEGRAMSLEEAALYALASEESDPSEATAPGNQPSVELTRREREVVYLVARGLTNRQVAEELSISERTAANHVARILGKLGLSSRTQVASWSARYQSPASEREYEQGSGR
jgi:DNA-binding CsgD family transcriptional regulator